MARAASIALIVVLAPYESVLGLSPGPHAVVAALVTLTVAVGNLDLHAKSMRNHVQTLGTKAYQAQFEEAPDYVVMFVPGEHFVAAGRRAVFAAHAAHVLEGGCHEIAREMYEPVAASVSA